MENLNTDIVAACTPLAGAVQCGLDRAAAEALYRALDAWTDDDLREALGDVAEQLADANGEDFDRTTAECQWSGTSHEVLVESAVDAALDRRTVRTDGWAVDVEGIHEIETPEAATEDEADCFEGDNSQAIWDAVVGGETPETFAGLHPGTDRGDAIEAYLDALPGMMGADGELNEASRVHAAGALEEILEPVWWRATLGAVECAVCAAGDVDPVPQALWEFARTSEGGRTETILICGTCRGELSVDKAAATEM